MIAVRLRFLLWSVVAGSWLLTTGCEPAPPIAALRPDEQRFVSIWRSPIIPVEGDALSKAVSYEVILLNRQSQYRSDPPSVWGTFREQNYFKSSGVEAVLWVVNEGNPTTELKMIPRLSVAGTQAKSDPLNGEWLGIHRHWEIQLLPGAQPEQDVLLVTFRGDEKYQGIRLQRAEPAPDFLPGKPHGY